MKIVDDFLAGPQGAPRSGAKERQEGRWLGDLERAWLANWTQLSGQDQDRRPEGTQPAQDRGSAGPIAVGGQASTRRPMEASLDGSAAPVPAGRRDDRPRPMGAQRLSGDLPARRDVPGAVPESPVSRVNASHGAPPRSSMPQAESGLAQAPADSMAAAPREARAPLKPQANSRPASEQVLERFEPDLVATEASIPSVMTIGAAEPLKVTLRWAEARRQPAGSQVEATASNEKPLAAASAIRHPFEAGTQPAAAGQGDLEAASMHVPVKAFSDQIAHLAPAYFADQVFEADAANERDPIDQATAAVSPTQLSVTLTSLARSASGDGPSTALPAVIAKAGNALFGAPGVASAIEPRRPESQHEVPHEPRQAGATSRPAAATQGPPPDKTSLNVSTSGDVAQVTVRDSSLSGDEVLRVGHVLALQLQQLGFSSVKTYVNGVARRVDSVYGSQTLAAEAMDASCSDSTHQGKAAK